MVCVVPLRSNIQRVVKLSHSQGIDDLTLPVTLCEEYLLRHSYDSPFVRYVNSGVLFLEQDEGWMVVLINWHFQPYHPGRYSFTFNRPVHNSYDLQDNMLSPVDVWSGNWDEYEDEILSWSSTIKGRPVLSKCGVFLAAWEIFLISHDGLLASKIHPDRIYKTVDEDISMGDRYRYLHQLLSYLSSRHPNIYNEWIEQIAPYVHDYSYWLGEIVRKESSGEKESFTCASQ